MLLNNGWGHQAGMAVHLRERGYLLDGERSEVDAGSRSKARKAPGGPARVLRLVVTGLALVARTIGERA